MAGFATVLLTLSVTSCSSFVTSSHRQINQHQTPTMSDGIVNGYDLHLSGSDNTDTSIVFDWPVDRARLTRGYRLVGRRPHLGIDLAGPRKTPVMSAHPGMVIYVGRDFRGFGKMILIESGNGWATLYAHLDEFLVSEGQKVGVGEPIALMGNTGRSTGPHLHFEIRKDKGPVDPLTYLPGGMEASRKLASKGG